MTNANTIRPDGRTYHPRGTPNLIQFETGDGQGVAVLGTHDLEAAYRMAWSTIQYLDLHPEARLVWWRRVPWDAYGIGCYASYIEDDHRGAPAVVWGI